MGELVPVQKSILTGEGIKEIILSRFLIGADCQCGLFRPGVNDTYKVKDGEDVFYFRVYTRNWRTREGIESELRLLEHLHAHEISVAVPVKDNEGEYIIEINTPEGLRYAVLFESAKGSGVTELDTQISEQYGRVVALIHNASDSLKKMDRFELDMKHLLDAPLKKIQPLLSHREADFKFIEELTKALKAKIFELDSKSKLDYGVCHGDFHYANIFSNEKGEISVFDFDCFGYGWRAYDISVFLWSCVPQENLDNESNDKRIRLWEAFLKGYSTNKLLNKNEVKAAFVFVVIRHIWLLGLHIEGTPIWGHSWIHDRYFDNAITFIKQWTEKYKILE